jgi:transcriptional regulator GlxA family with amidase domain
MPGVIDVLFVLLPQTLLMDLAGPAEALRLANQRRMRRGQTPLFRLRFVGPHAQCESSVGAVLSQIEPLPRTLPSACWVMLLGQPNGHESALQDSPPRSWLSTRQWLAKVLAPRLETSSGSARLLTVCAGALLAADAGLLVGRRCTTHHEMLDELQRLAPAAHVVANRVFVQDGPIFSSAGISAGVDMALHLIAEAGGDALAAAVAQTMVVYLRRGQDDPERSPLLAGRHHLHPAVHRVQDAVCEQPAKAWSLQEMSRLAHVTPRHLARLFATHVGQSPRAYVEGVRVAVAHQALQGGQSVKQAIAAAGFAGDRQWRRARGRSPRPLPEKPDLRGGRGGRDAHAD